jgi:rod shape-determining protein MreC
MDTILGRFRNLIFLAAILFAQIVGLAVQIKSPTGQGDTRLIRVWAVMAITPLEKAVINTQNFVSHAWANYVYLRGVRRENRELRAELDRMKLEQVRLREDADMARRIQSLLAFKEQYIDSTVAAQVIGTSGSDQSRALYIDKGSTDGLHPDMAVITPNGIVGKIEQVFPDSAQVLPINDQLSGVGIALKSSRLQGILRGAANGAITVQYVMADERVVPGEEVVTSGGDRVFPKGLPVGKVVAVSPGKDLFLNIRVQPAAHLNRLEEVLVVTKVTEKAPDVNDLGPISVSDILARRLPTVPEKPAAGTNGNATNPPAPGAAPATKPKPPDAAATGTPATKTPTTPGANPSTRAPANAPTVSGAAGAGEAAVKKPSAAVPEHTTQPPVATATPETAPPQDAAGEAAKAAPKPATPKPARKLPDGSAPETGTPPTPQPDNPQR